MFRAKFRVLSVEVHHDGLTIARLGPVTAKSPYSTGAADSEENAAFWSATPSGEISLRYVAGAAPEWLQPRAAVLVNFDAMSPVPVHNPTGEGYLSEAPPARWTLGAVTRRGSQLDLELHAYHTGGAPHADNTHPGLSAGELKMSIQRVPTIRRLLEVLAPQLEAQLADAEAGRGNGYQGWRVTFTPAP